MSSGPQHPAGAAPVLVTRRDDLLQCGKTILQGYDYWLMLCTRAGGLARRADIRPQDIRDLLSRFVLIALYQDGIFAPRFRLVGTRFEELNGTSLTGRDLREVYLPADYAEMVAVYRDMVATAIPRYLESELRRPGREMYRIRRLMLPMADADGRVAFLAGVIDESPSPAGLHSP